MKRILLLLSRLQRYVNRPWYPVLVAVLAGLDLFVIVVPTDGLLISAVLMQPKRWISIFLMVAVGSAAGSAPLAALFQWNPQFVTEHFFPGLFHSGSWESVSTFVRLHGVLALGLVSLGPLPMPPGVIVAALAPMPLGQIFLSVLIGRLFKYGLFSWLASHAPEFLYRSKLLRKEVAVVIPEVDKK